MADTQPFRSEMVYDRVDTFELGMNSGLDALLLTKNQLSFASNMTVRQGFATDRPPFTKNLDLVWPSDEVQTAVETGLWQGGGYYQPDEGNQSLFASISGRLFQFAVNGNTVTVTERTIAGDPNPATATQAWFSQSENFLIVQNGINLPLFFDGASTRRSAGPSVTLASATTSTSPAAFAIPAIGQQVVLTLAAAWPDLYNVPVLFNGEYYQPIANSGGYVVDLTSLYSVPGEAINVNDSVNQIPSIAGVVAVSPSFIPGGVFTSGVTNISITLTAPYTGLVDPSLFSLPGAWVLLFGSTWAVNFVTGNTIQVVALGNGTFPVSLAVGERIQFAAAAAPNTLIGSNTAATTAPVTGGTVQLTLTQAYNGAAGAIVYLNSGQYTITAVAPAPGTTAVTLINLTDPGTAYDFTNPLPIVSVPELPAGRQITYGLAQTWMTLVDGLSFICSDASRGPSGTPANSYRDAVLKTTDLTFRGGNFAIPGAGNAITSMTFTANLDQSLGQGSLQIGTAEFMASCQAPFDFLNPDNENPILTFSLIGTGPLAQDSTIPVNSDIYFRSIFGIGSLIQARRDFLSPGNTPISDEVRERMLELDDQTLLAYGSSITFDNRFLTTLSPQPSAQGVLHAGLVAQNLDPVSGIRDKQPPVYDGLWTGINTLKLLTGTFSGKKRGFAFTFNVSLSKIELYELLPTNQVDHFDNGTIPIVWGFETAALFNEDVKPRGTMVSLRDGEFAVSDVIGPVRFEVYYKADQGCWTAWHAFSICADEAGIPQAFPRLGLGEPSSASCDNILNNAARDGYTFQVKFKITGHCRFLRARFAAVTLPIPKFQPPLCDEVVLVEV